MRRYRLVLRSAVGVLLLLVASLTVATTRQGPQVTSVQVSPEGVVERDGARLRLRLDRPVNGSVAERVSIEPAAGSEVTVVGSEITISFTELLRYGTEYTVTIADVRSRTGTTSDLVTRFTTAEPEVLALETSDDGPDRITGRPLDGGEERVLFEADSVSAYAVSGTVLAAVVEEGGTALLETVDVVTGARRTVPVPSAVIEIRGSSSAPRIGYTVATVDGPVLRTLDVSDPEAEPVVVADEDGAELAIAQWAFEPGSTSLAALTEDGVLLRVDAGTEAPTVLGEHGELRGFVPGTSDLVVSDPGGGAVVDLRTGREAPLELPARVDGAASGEERLLDGSSYLRTVTDRSGGAFDVSSAVVLFDGYAERELFRPAEGAALVSTCLSPNGQYLAVHTAPAGSTVVDRTVLIDVETGGSDHVLAGASLDWC